MSKQTSKKTETVQAAQPTETVAAAPKAAKTPKATKATKEAAPTPVPAPVEAPVAATPVKKSGKKQAAPVPEPVTEVVASTEAAAPAEAQAVTSDYTEFMTKLQQVSSLLSALKSEFRLLEKKAVRELRTANKANAKRKRKTGNRSPSGFVKPTLISGELATFLNKPAGSEMARTEVTREINEYIRTHSLQDKTNGRKINADASLMALLKLKEGDELTYFNLQRYMSPHFAKAGVAPVASVASA
jgi:upstream activation factor subunit UAF30